VQVGAPAPIFRSIARLSAPGLALAAFQAAVSIADTHFVGRLGTEPLAGLALVFPLVMLLQMTSAGAMGGGVSSAIARARGAGNEATARRLVVHAMVIALSAGLLFTAVFLVLGRPLYSLLGGTGGALAQASA
jgi:Na+-driven multidrug efflux pump